MVLACGSGVLIFITRLVKHLFHFTSWSIFSSVWLIGTADLYSHLCSAVSHSILLFVLVCSFVCGDACL